MSEVQKTRNELLSEMREHQAAYAKLAAELKALSAADEAAALEERQLKRLEDYKAKYKYYAAVGESGDLKEIDWDEVEKLVKASFGTGAGYSLGFNEVGQEGLGHDYGNGGHFSPMFEDALEIERYKAREVRRQQFAANKKSRG